MKKILITGASGYLAGLLVPLIAERAEVVGVARRAESIYDPAQAITLDLTQRGPVLDTVLGEQPDAIIHCAACNPGGSEADMLAINELATGNIAEAARRVDCRLVTVSSDTVFSGRQAPYADNAVASPLEANAYAVSKAKGEALTLSIKPDASIVRTSLIYDLGQIDRGTEGFAKRLKSGQPLKLFSDVFRQPVHAPALAESLSLLALNHVNESGTINVAGSEVCSRYRFGVRMMDYWGIDYAGSLQEVSGVGIEGLPMDLRMQLDRAAELSLPTPGLSEILKKPKGV